MIATIPDELTSFVEQSVTSGRYADADEAVAAGLRLLQQTDRTGDDPGMRLVAARQTLLDEIEKSDDDLGDELQLRNDGAFVVLGHRVSVHLILQAWSDGLTLSAIHDRFPTIATNIIERLSMFAAEQPIAVARWLVAEELAAERQCTEVNRGPSLEELRRRLATRTAG